MKTYISILRGINVSGYKPIKMKTLKEMYESLGFTNVRTYIQSGNVVFENDSTETVKQAIIISEGILKSFGFDVSVLPQRIWEYKTQQYLF